MPLAQVQTAVETFLRANWTTTDIAFENDGYEPMAGASDGLIQPWILCEVFAGLYEQRSVGAGRASADFWSDSGTIWLHIFVGSGTGSLLAKQYGSTLAELFRGLELPPNIAFGDISLSGSGGSSNGNDWSLSCSIDWIQG